MKLIFTAQLLLWLQLLNFVCFVGLWPLLWFVMVIRSLLNLRSSYKPLLDFVAVPRNALTAWLNQPEEVHGHVQPPCAVTATVKAQWHWRDARGDNCVGCGELILLREYRLFTQVDSS